MKFINKFTQSKNTSSKKIVDWFVHLENQKKEVEKRKKYPLKIGLEIFQFHLSKYLEILKFLTIGVQKLSSFN